MIQPTLEHDIWIAVPRERAWQAITEMGEIKQWWGANADVEIIGLHSGGAIKFGTADGPILATIRTVTRPYQFVYEWPPHPRYFSVPFVTSYILEEEGNGTRVRLSESGFDAWPDDDIRRERFDRLSAGFRQLLENLKGYLEETG